MFSIDYFSLSEAGKNIANSYTKAKDVDEDVQTRQHIRECFENDVHPGKEYIGCRIHFPHVYEDEDVSDCHFDDDYWESITVQEELFEYYSNRTDECCLLILNKDVYETINKHVLLSEDTQAEHEEAEKFLTQHETHNWHERFTIKFHTQEYRHYVIFSPGGYWTRMDLQLRQ